MKHKTRNGILAFFAGLFIVMGALYMDQIQGNASGSIGLYQIVGALAGYIISGIGIALVVKQTDARKSIRNILLYGGASIVVVSVLADLLGIAGVPGFDKFQSAGTIVGLLIVGVGFFLLR